MRTIETIEIAGRLVGDGQPCFIIAEAGVNHNGDLAVARRLVDAARAAGADAVKFQKRKLSEVYRQEILDDPRTGEQGLQYLVPLLVEFELPDAEFRALAEYARQQGILFLCTPWDRQSVDLLEDINLAAHKIGSPDMTNHPLIEYVARTGKPMFVSTGMSTEEEIHRTLSYLKSLHVPCGVFHCVSAYPVSADEINLRFMQKLQEWWEWPVGYSGHEQGISISVGAVAMGARMLERHLTLDRSMRGPDHRASLEPAEFADLVRAVREMEAALGVPHRWMSRAEVLNRRVLAKSLVAAADIPAGAIVTAELIESKSPGLGLSPQAIDQLVGSRIRRPMRKDDIFKETDLLAHTDAHKGRPIDLDLAWGVVTRFGDLDPLLERFLPQGMSLVELHLSDRDVDAGVTAFLARRHALELVVHAAEYCHDVLIDLCAADESQRLLSVQRIQKTMDLARAIAGWFDKVPARGPKVVVHVGGMSPDGRSYDTGAAADRLMASLEALETDGVDLLLENLPPCPWYFGGRWAGYMLVDAANTVELCERSGLGLCFDTSHAALACHHSGASLTEFARAVQPYVRHLHVSDGAGISGEGLQIGEGDIEFLPLWTVMTSTRATLVPEIWQGHHDLGRGFQTALERLSEINWAARALTDAEGRRVRSDLAQFIAPVDATIATALQKIQANKFGVFLVDEAGVVKGVSTDGDIRRALLAGSSLSTSMATVMTKDFVFATSDATPADIADLLSRPVRYRMIPILDAAHRLVGVAR